VLDRVVEDREVVIVRRRGSADVALVAAEELSGLMETAYLLQSPANAGRLLTAVRRTKGRRARLPPWISCGGIWALSQPGEREAMFQPEFREDLRWWVETNRSTALRIVLLVEAVLADAFQGIGKPERLKSELLFCRPSTTANSLW
jgi:PHD/YefM family antitoxin component YafN of YafNO toxin-antitoxin module